MKISDIAEVINETVKEPSKSGIDVFVGLEHYDIAEPVIKRFGSTQMLSTAAKVFNKGDVLIARRNVYLQRAAMAPFSGLTSGDSIVLRVKDNFDTKETDYETMSKLLPFILNSIDFWDYANTNADGTMSKRLSPALLLDYEFDLPSIEEQKLRAEKLWAAYEVKQSYLKMIKATQEMVQSQFIEMFGKTTNRVSLSSLCDTFIDGDWIEAKDQSESGIRLIQTGNVGVGIFKDKGEKARYISEETFNRLNCTEVVEGDILISRLPDPVGRACIIPDGLGKSITAVDCTIIKLKELILPKFFIAFTNSPDYAMQIKKVLSGTTRLRVSRTNLGNILVPLPSIEEQLRFVSIAHQADKSEFELRKSIDAIDAVIKSLINN